MHYMSPGRPVDLAAIIVKVVDEERGVVNLTVFLDDAYDLEGGSKQLGSAATVFRRMNVEHSNQAETGKWHWIEEN